METQIDLSDEVLEQITSWLAAAGEPSADLAHLLRALDDLDIDEELPYIADSLALSTEDGDWSLLVPTGGWTWRADLASERVIVIDDSGDIETCTVDELRNRSTFWLEPGFAVHSSLDLEASRLPFRFDGVMWAGTLADHAFGESEWRFRSNGEETFFDLEDMDLGFLATDHAAPGRWLSIECSGYSMSTGEIGVTLYVTDSGGLFLYQWGYRTSFLGHADVGLDVDEILASLDPDNVGYSLVHTITSERLTKKQMRTVVACVRESDVNALDPDDVQVECRRWKGTVAELMA